MTIVLTGDSITDASRDRDNLTDLGAGYAALVARELTTERVLNTGIGGNRVIDLQARWDTDVLAHSPAVVSIMIGINDTWRRYDSGDPTSAAAFESGYRDVLRRTRAAGVGRILLIEPFLVPVRPDQWSWREDLDPKIAVVRRLAEEFGADLVATDGPFAQAASASSAADLAYDGVHPAEAGHGLLASRWLEVYHSR
ncbi:MAG: SGNH/GDSL hydrolase family protein [Actinomycetales bacterium]|nr:SGNH/GDSL hydrolase family protein [Actinomycetales bacterium]